MKTKRQHLPKGFLSKNGKPTVQALVMFLIYLLSLPKDWNEMIIHSESVDKVRAHFGTDHGFDVMIKWGIHHGCCKSKTSSGRHTSMSSAYTMAKSCIGGGIVMSDIPMMFPMLRKVS